MRKHGVAFDEGCTLFGDPQSRTIEDAKHSLEEQRYVIIGMSNCGRILVVVYTEREVYIRIISARTATHKEKRDYEENIST